MKPIAYLGGGVALTTTVLGHKIFVDTADIVVSPHVLIEGNWEPWIAQFLRFVIQPGMTVVDVGAHIGWYTLLAAELVGDKGRVHAYEPNPFLASLIERSISVNGFKARATVHRAAASDVTGLAPLFVPRNRSGNGRLLPDDGTESEDTEKLMVRTIRLGDWHPDQALQGVDFIKVDAEGHELRVLRGAEALLDNPKIALLIEHHPGEDGELLMSTLLARGFRCAVVEHDATLRELTPSNLHTVPDSEMLYFQR